MEEKLENKLKYESYLAAMWEHFQNAKKIQEQFNPNHFKYRNNLWWIIMYSVWMRGGPTYLEMKQFLSVQTTGI